MFYVQDVGHRWATQAVSYKTLEQAEHAALRDSHDCWETRVFDCSKSPIGKLVCRYVRGERVEA
jgi:hypothetical protein